jgi:hypothetical protein
MLTKFAAALLAIVLSAGSVHAMSRGFAMSRSFAMSRALSHFPICSEGLVKAKCVCRAAGASRQFELCPSGRYCHTFDGACRQ